MLHLDPLPETVDLERRELGLRPLTDVQTLEATELSRLLHSERSELSRLLHAPCFPKYSRNLNVVRPPDSDVPHRCEFIDWYVSKYGEYPDPELEIVFGCEFSWSLIPTTGKLYACCTFHDCDLATPKGNWSLIDCNIESGTRMWWQAMAYGGTLRGNLVI